MQNYRWPTVQWNFPSKESHKITKDKEIIYMRHKIIQVRPCLPAEYENSKQQPECFYDEYRQTDAEECRNASLK